MQRFSLIIISALAAFALFYGPDLTNLIKQDSLSVNSDHATLRYDSYAEGITTTLFNELGDIDYILAATRQVHYLEEFVDLDSPFIRLYRNGEVHWNITAESGRILRALESEDNIERVDLDGNVELFSFDKTGSRILLTTDTLQLNPISETLETEQAVRMVGRDFEQDAIGMHANLVDDTIVFKRNVRGRYATKAN